ncbi:TolC family protein [Oligoflexus tunisiensis]|uniref:TolC family protein n=1 Tax=Oligoflexus tunisiensis TaxID=708132 RepID=UPI00159F10A4|nr:TolC family protein [Oligoflexus tunisiensis]
MNWLFNLSFAAFCFFPYRMGLAQETRAPVTSGPAAVTLSIEDALRLAERASEDVTAAVAAVKRAEAQQMQARSEWYPQINGSLSYDRLLEPDVDDLAASGMMGPTAGTGFMPFFQENTWRAGFTLSQNIFAGGRSLARQGMSNAARKIAELDLDAARALTVLTTVQGYYDAVLGQQLVTIAEAALQQAEITLKQVKLGGRQGTRPEFDVLRAQVTVENQRPQLLTARMQRDQALLRLKQFLDIPLEKDLVLTSTLEEEQMRDLTSVARQTAHLSEPRKDQDSRLVVEQALTAVEMREAGVDLAKSQHWPNISAVSNYGWAAYPESGLPESKEWFRNWTAGVQLTVPIFSGLRIQGEQRSAAADLEEAQARARQIREQAALDARSAADQLASAKAQWEASAGTVSQAERAYQIAEIRYRDGISTQLELADSRLQLQQAQANRARAARDLQVARVRFTLLPHLPLSAASIVRSDTGSLSSGTANTAPTETTPAAQGVGTVPN